MERSSAPRARRALSMLFLVLAGESIFLPPFHPGRYFKSSLLATFDMSEFQLGQLGAIYGAFAMGAYVLGGPLADRFSPRKLIALSLVATGLGSLYMSSIPSFRGLTVLFGFWGLSTILLFWAPLIRATREWGGADGQGRAFGILDGGRGLAAALIAAAAVAAFGVLVGGEAVLDPAREASAVRVLLAGYGGVCLLVAVGAWLFVPEPARAPTVAEAPPEQGVVQRIGLVLRLPAVWLMALVIIAAYSAFKMFDNYGLYTEDAYGLTRAGSAQLIAGLSFLRLVAALAAGWIADRVGVARTIRWAFLTLVATYGIFLVAPPREALVGLIVANMAVSCAAFFALRGIYFALLEESAIPRAVTGTAVGVACFVGFTPEIFMPLVTGYLITHARDAGDVLVGYDQIFAILAGLVLTGAVATTILDRLGRRR